MSVPLQMQAMHDRNIRHFGGGAVATLRRKHSILSTRGGVVADLRVAVQAAIGATSLMLAGTGLKGELPAGIELEIAGDATVYTVAAPANGAGGSLAVTITPPLVALAAVGAAVTLADSADYTGVPVLRAAVTEEDIARGFAGQSAKLQLSALALGDVEPQRGDLVSFGGREELVLDVRRVGQGDIAGRWDLIVGEAR